jgi:two-component system sensor histidine kinase DegS
VTNRLTGPTEIAADLRDVVSLAQKTLGDARRAVWDLRGPPLAGVDFPARVRTLLEDCLQGTGLSLEYKVEGPPRAVDPEVEAAAVRVVQEAVTNTVKHAAACKVRVTLSFEPRRIRLAVLDDGRGFAVDPNFHAYGGHWGLLGMRERATQIHGNLRVRSHPGEGTEVVLLIPYAMPRGVRPPPVSADVS